MGIRTPRRFKPLQRLYFLAFAVLGPLAWGLAPGARAQVTPTITATPSAFYYVSTSGSDTNPGTEASPWLTIQHAANTVPAGSTVYVMGGLYNEVITINVSGSAAAGFTTFENYPGEAVTIDGTGLSIPGGQYGLITIQNQSFITIQGFQIQNYTSSNGDVPIGIYVTGYGSYIQILDNHILDITTTDSNAGEANALGLAVYGSSTTAISNLLISGNELDDMVTGNSETFTLNGNVQYWTVSDNLIHDNNNIGLDAIGFEGVAPTGSMCGSDLCDRARDGEIEGNTVYNITSNDNPAYGAGSYAADGIYVDGGERITIERNLVYASDLGFEVASENPGGQGYTVEMAQSVTVRDNIAYQNNAVGLSIGGYADTGAGGGATSLCSFYNNTFYDNDTAQTGSGEFQVQYHAFDNVFMNNILYANSQGLLLSEVTNPDSVPATMNYNLYYTTATPNWQWNGATYTSLANFQAGSGQDAQSKFGNPDFVSTSAPNFQLTAGSPALSAGDDLGTAVVGSLDFAGNPRIVGNTIDMGAYESSYTLTPNATATPSPTSPAGTPTATPTMSPTGTDSMTPSVTASSTSSPSPSQTPTDSFTPTGTASLTASSTATNSATPSASATPSSTPTLTITPSWTSSPTLTTTATATSTPSSTATSTAALTLTSTASITPTFTPSSTPSLTPTQTASLTPTFPATPSPTASPTASPSSTATGTPSPTPSRAPTSTATFTPSVTPTLTPLNMLTASATASWTSSPSPSQTPTASLTPTGTPSSAPTGLSTFTPSPTPSSSPSGPGPLIYPNPWVGGGPLKLSLPLSNLSRLRVEAFTVAFRKVLDQDWVPASAASAVTIAPVDSSGAVLANGLYYVRVTAGGQKWLLKLLILR